MATYITIFLFEIISALFLWFVLKKILKTNKFYTIVIICLVVSLIVGYIASYRMVGYGVTLGYLTEINDQRIAETGQGITLSEENEYKEELFRNQEFRNIILISAIKISLIPFVLVVFIMLFLVKKAEKKLLFNRDINKSLQQN